MLNALINCDRNFHFENFNSMHSLHTLSVHNWAVLVIDKIKWVCHKQRYALWCVRFDEQKKITTFQLILWKKEHDGRQKKTYTEMWNIFQICVRNASHRELNKFCNENLSEKCLQFYMAYGGLGLCTHTHTHTRAYTHPAKWTKDFLLEYG